MRIGYGSSLSLRSTMPKVCRSRTRRRPRASSAGSCEHAWRRGGTNVVAIAYLVRMPAMLLLSMGILSLAMSIAAFEKGARADEPIVTVAPASSSQLVSVARPSTSYDELRRILTPPASFSSRPLAQFRFSPRGRSRSLVRP